jgi:ABC-2 type transport system ATP-binding protein
MQLVLKDVSYSYAGGSAFTLGPLSFTIDTGKITALIGSNGSGKTTFIKVLINELIGYDGTYAIDGRKVHDTTGSLLHTYRIGYAPEHPVLEERLTGREIMELLKDIHEISDDDFTEQVAECEKALHLEEWFDHSPCREYSQGMRKKVSLMIALIGQPRYIIIDEPTNGLDPLATFGLKKLLARRIEKGMGVLVSSHMLDFVERVASEVIILKKGVTAFAGTVEHLFSEHPGKQLDEIYYHLFMQEPQAIDL